MSTLKKNKRIKRAKLLALYGEQKPVRGNRVTQRGKAKYLGGNGRQTTGVSRRMFRKNLKRIRLIEDGRVVRRRVPVSLIRSGGIQKPQVVDPFAIPEMN
ncbi:MAG: 50S ribosomal protein L28 [Planctomycetaceae bacterium]|nr:50S ribosomal protein L28 [Planctomycetaceae bacterium]